MLKNFFKKTAAIFTICLILCTSTYNTTPETIDTSSDVSMNENSTHLYGPFRDPNEWN